MDTTTDTNIITTTSITNDTDTNTTTTTTATDHNITLCFQKLIQTIYDGDIDTISLLLKESPYIVNMKSDVNDFTTLHYVCRDGPSNFAKHVSYDDKTKIAKLLIDNGADVNVISKDGRTPLMYSCLVEHIDMIRLLIKNGADVNKTDKNGQASINYVMNFLPGQTSDDALFELVKADVNVPVGHRFEKKVRRLKQVVTIMKLKEEVLTLKKENLELQEENEFLQLQIDLQPPALPYLNDNDNDNDSNYKKYRGGGKLFHQVEDHYYEQAKKQKKTNNNNDNDNNNNISYIN